MGVVKADAYGHGAPRCALRLEREGASWFGVALPEEGIELRHAGIGGQILCLGGFWQGQAAALISKRLTPVVYDLEMLRQLDRAAAEAATNANVHIKVDTGMGRLGVRYDAVHEFAERVTEFKHIRVEGVMTHFAAADIPSLDGFTRTQADRYDEALGHFRAVGIEPVYHDLANSAATMSHPFAHGNLVRPGGILYGLWHDILQPDVDGSDLRPVMSLHSRIELLKRVPAGDSVGYGGTFTTRRDSLIATLPIGYHDGFPRANSNRGKVIVRGQFVPVIGRVSMDLTIIDVTDVIGIAPGDTVTLIGSDGDRSINAEDVAKVADTLSYEVTCGISSRVPRVYQEREV
jgi:alanine racemase